MNREQFIAQLARLLQDLPPAERQEAIRYYQEYFDDAGEENEDAVIQELGSPGKVVASIKANLQYGGSTFGANDTDMENTGTESQTKDADGWQQNGQTMNRWNQSTQQGWQNADTQGRRDRTVSREPGRMRIRRDRAVSSRPGRIAVRKARMRCRRENRNAVLADGHCSSLYWSLHLRCFSALAVEHLAFLSESWQPYLPCGSAFSP